MVGAPHRQTADERLRSYEESRESYRELLVPAPKKASSTSTRKEQITSERHGAQIQLARDIVGIRHMIHGWSVHTQAKIAGCTTGGCTLLFSKANRSSLRSHRVEGITHKQPNTKYENDDERSAAGKIHMHPQPAKATSEQKAGHPHLQSLTLYWPFEATRRLTTTPMCGTKKR